MKYEWISVHEELPPLGKLVYVRKSYRDTSKKRIAAARRQEGNGWVWRDTSGAHLIDIQYWQKIPKGMTI